MLLQNSLTLLSRNKNHIQNNSYGNQIPSAAFLAAITGPRALRLTAAPSKSLEKGLMGMKGLREQAFRALMQLLGKTT